jgi:hypothetical protein
LRTAAVLIGIVALIAAPAGARAQTRVALMRGVGEYDLSGVDSGNVTALRVSRDLRSFLALEAGVSQIRLDEDIGEADLYQPEVQLQLQLPLGPVTPYLGGGAGMAFAFSDTAEDDTDVTLNAGAGLRIALPFRLGLVVDGRLRTFGTRFTASGADAAIGLSYTF